MFSQHVLEPKGLCSDFLPCIILVLYIYIYTYYIILSYYYIIPHTSCIIQELNNYLMYTYVYIYMQEIERVGFY